jgi:hypothetical protein
VYCQLDGGRPPVGGRQDVDLKTISKEELDNLNKLANFGIAKIAEQRVKCKNGDQVKLSLVLLSKVQKQVVAGVDYFLTVLIKPDNCSNNCTVEQCEMTIYSRPWENSTELSNFVCKRQR